MVEYNLTRRTQSTADPLTVVVVANTPPRKPCFARLISLCATLAPQRT